MFCSSARQGRRKWKSAKGLLDSISPMCTLSQNGYGIMEWAWHAYCLAANKHSIKIVKHWAFDFLVFGFWLLAFWLVAFWLLTVGFWGVAFGFRLLALGLGLSDFWTLSFWLLLCFTIWPWVFGFWLLAFWVLALRFCFWLLACGFWLLGFWRFLAFGFFNFFSLLKVFTILKCLKRQIRWI